MRNATVAEWILGLVTDPARAAATVGDLLEEDRGPARFWSSVLRTAASHIVHEIWHHPFAIVRVAVVVYFEMLLAALVLSAVMNFIIRTWMNIAPYPVGPNAIYIPRWGFLLLIFALFSSLSSVSGWETARQSKGREIAVGIAVFAFYTAIGMFAPLRQDNPVYSVPRVLDYLSAVCYWIALVLCRLRAQQREKALPPGVANA